MTGSSYPPTYDGVGADAYLEWEIAIDNIFATRCMCPRRKVKNAASVLRHSALVWWDSLSSSDKPQTWIDMKLLMRETFVNPPPALNSYNEVQNIEDQSIDISLATPNLLQDAEQKQEDKDGLDKNEELTSSCENSEPSLHNAPITLAEIESKGNAHGAALMDGEVSFDVLNSSTNHAMTEKLLVGPTLDLPLSQHDLIHIPCDKDDLPGHEHESTEPHVFAEFTNVIHVASDTDEMKLLSSLHTLGYIEFDVLCNLSNLKEKLFMCADWPWLSRHTYHVIGKYNYKGQYLIRRVYICANLNYSFVVQDCNQLSGSDTIDIHTPSIHMLPFVSTNLLQDSIDQAHVDSDQGAYRISFEYNRRRGRLFFQEGEDDESTTPSDMTIDYKVSSFQINLSSGFENKLLTNDLIIVRNHGDDEEDVGEEFGGMVDQQGQPSRVGGPIQVEFESASESRSSNHQNQRPGRIRSPFGMLFIWMEI